MKFLGAAGYFIIAAIVGFIALVFYAIFGLSSSSADSTNKVNYLIPIALAILSLMALIRGVMVLREKKGK